MFPYNNSQYNPAMTSVYGQPQYLSQMSQQRQEIPRVTGLEGAKAYPLPPRSSVILQDAINDKLIWAKFTDDSGFPTINAYTITPYEPEKPKSNTDELEKRISRLEGIINEYITDASESESGSGSA